MSVEPVPSRLEPRFLPRIWGTRRLDSLFSAEGEFPEPIGEAWLTGRDCRLADGPFAGRTLEEAWRAMPLEWVGWRLSPARRSLTGGGEREDFPLLVKFIFPAEKLSIQVHPDDDYARAHEAAAGGRGKTEMWYAVAAGPGAEVLVGLRPGVTREKFRRAIADGVAEDCLERIPVEPGDAIFVPAGTVHTIGPGLVLCEIQEYSDITYRVFDYNRLTAEGRPRALHLEKALEVLRPQNKRAGKVAPARVTRGGIAKTYFAACRYFAAEKWELAARAAAATAGGGFEILIILAGTGALECCRESKRYAPGQAWLLPANLGAYALAPDAPTALLRAYVPDLAELELTLTREGVAEAERARLIAP
jgi:mannose-6-phosphate isomerase